MIIDQAQHYREKVIGLLSTEQLPVADLPVSLDHFMVAIQDAIVVGVIGLEIYGQYGLLRSLAVQPDQRGNGIAGKLLKRIEALAGLKKLRAIILLTETAPDYFSRKGYQAISRSDAPVEIQQSSEFSHVCPVSAVVMKKTLNN